MARRAQRSVAFVVHRALLVGKGSAGVEGGPTAPLLLATDDEDPPGLLGKLETASGGRPLEQAVAAAWPVAREKFQAWLARLEEAAQAERADDLDSALAEAANSATGAQRLAELSKSEYPKIRALVAAHASTPKEVVAKLQNDRERSVREAASARA